MNAKLSAAELAKRMGPWTHRDPVLYRALSASVEDLIREGRLAPWTQLPAERSLAQELNVSRGTVMAAYEQLRDLALVATVHGSGTVVQPEGSPVSGPREAHVTTALPFESLFTPVAAANGDTIDLRSASWVGADAVEGIDPQRLHRRLVGAASAGGWDPMGVRGLRDAIARRLTSLGLPTSGDEILVTSGAQQAISLTVQLHLGAGDTALAEDPTYPGAIEAMVAQQALVRRVPVGQAGVDLPSLRAAVDAYSPRLVYLVASVHNPTGAVMPGPARQRLAELHATWNTVIVDDTTLLETQFEGSPPAPLAAYADGRTAARIITVGSLSKAVWDGLRIGWVRAPRPTIERLARLKALADLATPVMTQAVAEELLNCGDDTFARRREQLRHRRDVMAGLLREHLPSWSWDEGAGGLCLWVDTGLEDSAAFCTTASSHGVALIPAAASSATRRFSRHLRLPYSYPVDTLREATVRLAAAWQHHTAARQEPAEDLPEAI